MVANCIAPVNKGDAKEPSPPTAPAIDSGSNAGRNSGAATANAVSTIGFLRAPPTALAALPNTLPISFTIPPITNSP